jgi:hypothetical protein
VDVAQEAGKHCCASWGRCRSHRSCRRLARPCPLFRGHIREYGGGGWSHLGPCQHEVAVQQHAGAGVSAVGEEWGTGLLCQSLHCGDAWHSSHAAPWCSHACIAYTLKSQLKEAGLHGQVIATPPPHPYPVKTHVRIHHNTDFPASGLQHLCSTATGCWQAASRKRRNTPRTPHQGWPRNTGVHWHQPATILHQLAEPVPSKQGPVAWMASWTCVS